jgi:hypothetical protein
MGVVLQGGFSLEKMATRKCNSRWLDFTVSLYKPDSEVDAEFGGFCRACGFDPGLSDEEMAEVTYAFVVAKTDEGGVAGFAQFGGGDYCNEVWVSEDHRRMGVATAMYDLYEESEGVKLKKHRDANENADRL